MLWRKHSIFEPKTFSTLRIHSNMSSLWGIKHTSDPFGTNLRRNKLYWVCRNIGFKREREFVNISVLFSFEFGVRYDLYIDIADSPKKLAKIEQLVDHKKPSIFEWFHNVAVFRIWEIKWKGRKINWQKVRKVSISF